MFGKITPLQWEYLNKPNGICILRFENKKEFLNALHWVDTIWRMPWEYLLVDEYSDSIVPNTILIPDDMFERFHHPYRGMVGKFEAEWLER